MNIHLRDEIDSWPVLVAIIVLLGGLLATLPTR